MQEFFKGILTMTEMDLIWGAPFSFLLTSIMKRLFDAYRKDGRRGSIRLRKRFLESIKADKTIYARRILQYGNDPILNIFCNPLREYLDGTNKGYDSLKSGLKMNLDHLLDTELSQEKALDTSNGNLTFLGFFGTLAAMMLLFGHFTLETNDFSQIFEYMATAIKSSAFCIATSIVVSEAMVFLYHRLEIKKRLAQEFYSNLIETITAIQKREELKDEKPKRTLNNSFCRT